MLQANYYDHQLAAMTSSLNLRNIRVNLYNLQFFGSMLYSIMGDHDQGYIGLALRHSGGRRESVTMGAMVVRSRTIMELPYEHTQ